MNYTLIVLLATISTACTTSPVSRRVTNIKGSTGTAFNVEYQNKVYGVTAGHVCSKSPINSLVYGDGEKVVKLSILSMNTINDICILSPIPNLKPLELDLSDVEPSILTAIGYAGFSQLEIKSKGRLSGVFIGPDPVTTLDNGECQAGSYPVDPKDKIQCIAVVFRIKSTSEVYPGMSGGPVINDDNRLVGVSTAMSLPSITPMYFTPVEFVKKEIKKLEQAN